MCAAFELRRLHCELDASLRIHIEEAIRGSGKFACVRASGLGTRVAPLHQCEDGDRRHQDETDQRCRRDAECATTATLGVVNRPFGTITGPQIRNCIGKHIVVDLVSSACAVLGARANDPLGSKSPQDVGGLLLFDLGVAGEIARAVRDL